MNDPDASASAALIGEDIRHFAGRLDDAFCCKDIGCRFTYANDAALRAVDLFGGAPVIGSRLSELCPTPDADRVERHDRAVIASGETSVVNESFVAAGYTRGYLVTRVPLRGEDGKVRGLACLWVERRAASAVIDVRDQSHARPESERLLVAEREERLRAEFSARARDQLLSIVSHDLRSPLNGIQSWTNVLEAQLTPESSPVMKRALVGIKTGVEEQVGLIENLMDAARILSGRVSLSKATVALAPIVQAAIDGATPLAVTREIRIVSALGAGEGRIRGDPDRLKQIASHLLANALRFSPLRAQIHVELVCEGATMRLRVSDQGKGAPADGSPQVFESFRTDERGHSRAQSGFGLELVLARHLTELHAGTVSASSLAPEQGAVFEARFPLA